MLLLWLSSATWPPAVQEMADRYMKDPFKVFVGTLDLAVSLQYFDLFYLHSINLIGGLLSSIFYTCFSYLDDE